MGLTQCVVKTFSRPHTIITIFHVLLGYLSYCSFVVSLKTKGIIFFCVGALFSHIVSCSRADRACFRVWGPWVGLGVVLLLRLHKALGALRGIFSFIMDG